MAPAHSRVTGAQGCPEQGVSDILEDNELSRSAFLSVKTHTEQNAPDNHSVPVRFECHFRRKLMSNKE